MKARFPLLAKIVGWFFLNLAVLGLVGWWLLRDQFAFSMLAARTAGDRVAEVAHQIESELQGVPRSQWDAILAKHGQELGLELFLYASDGPRLAGTTAGMLPPEVHSRVVGPPQGPQGPQGPRGRPGPPNEEDDFRPPREGPGRPQFLDEPENERPPNRPRRPPPPPGAGDPEDRRPFPPDGPPPGLSPGPQGRPPHQLADKLLIQTNHPERYWVFKRIVVDPGGGPMGAALITMSDSPSGHGLYFDLAPLLWAGAGVLLLSALVWFPLVGGITRSIGKMRTAAARLAEGQFEARVETGRRDELGELGADINRLAGRLSGYLDGQRRFLGDVAHELCAPVARLQMGVGILEQNAKTPEERERLADVRDEVEHMSGLVNELLQFTRAAMGGKKIELQKVAVKPIAEKAIHREACDTSQIRVQVDETLHVQAVPDLLQRALSNLIRNALRYAGHAGPITVGAVREGESVVITVTDRGPGVPEDAVAKLFDPFFRVDTARTPGEPGAGGTGLGLAIVKTCVEACGGTVSARNVAPSGLEVTLRVPAM